jgi:hypothetical protein
MKNILMYLVLAAATVSLSNCTTTSGLKRDSHSVTARSGERRLVFENIHLNGDCNFVGYPPIDIVEQPKHGRIDILHQLVVANSHGKKMKCDKVKANGVAVYYTSQPGFVGNDSFVLRTPVERGRLEEGVANVKVIK